MNRASRRDAMIWPVGWPSLSSFQWRLGYSWGS